MNDSTRGQSVDLLDRETVVAVLGGDSESFRAIVVRYTGPIHSLAFRSLGDRSDAEEAVQDIFLKAFRSLGTFDLSRRFYPWFYSIALNHLRSMRRRDSRRLESNAVSLSEELVPQDPTDRPSQPEAALLADATRRIVQRALEHLTAPQREAFVLRHIRGMSTADAAAIMDIPQNTVKTHLSRARKRIQNILADHDVTEAEW